MRAGIDDFINGCDNFIYPGDALGALLGMHVACSS